MEYENIYEELEKELKYNMKYGDINNDSNIYIELLNGELEFIFPSFLFLHTNLSNDNFDNNYSSPNTLILFHINIPEKYRNRGLFTHILSFIENKAESENKHLYVGPFMSDYSQYIIKILKRIN
jgi:hypothetical protein